jgi:hypothetical protein
LACDEWPTRVEQASQFVDDADLCAYILEINDAHIRAYSADQRFEPRLVDKYSRRDDHCDLCRAAGRPNAGDTSTEVNHGRNTPGGHQGQGCDGGAVGIWQHDADCLADAGTRGELSRQHRDAEQELSVGEGAGKRVLNRDAPAAVGVGGCDNGLDNRAVGRCGAENEFRHDLVKRGPGSDAAAFALEVRIDRELDGFAHGDRDLGKPTAADLRAIEPRERRCLRAFEAHRHDHGV